VYTAIEMPDGPMPSADLAPEDAGALVPRVFRDRELSPVRMAYLQAVINNVYRHLSVPDATENLCVALDMLAAAGALPTVPPPVRTLISAKKRLGIDADQWIVQYAICPKCWKHYAPRQLQELAGPGCLVTTCDGILYTEKRDSKNVLKRHPVKIIPNVSVIQSLRRMMRRKGFRKLIQSHDAHQIGQNDDDSFLMRDMSHGSMWSDLKTRIKREVGNFGTVRDIPAAEGSERRLTDNRIGLHLVINLDWCVAFHSAMILSHRR
jgi:hypothetical protein